MPAKLYAMTGRHGPCPYSLATERGRSVRDSRRADPVSDRSQPRPPAELAFASPYSWYHWNATCWRSRLGKVSGRS